MPRSPSHPRPPRPRSSRPPARLAAALLLALPAAGASAHVIDFEDAEIALGRLALPGVGIRPLGPGDVLADWTGGPGHGALAIEDIGPAGIDGARGRVLSTRDLSFPYGLTLEFEAPVVSVSGLWIAANKVWEARGLDAEGGLQASVAIDPAAGRFEVSAPAGIVRLDLRSSDGWDWLWLDDLTLRFAGLTGAGARGEALATPAVPLPAPLGLLAAALGGLVTLRAVWRRVALLT